jgi:hypothetical protein
MPAAPALALPLALISLWLGPLVGLLQTSNQALAPASLFLWGTVTLHRPEPGLTCHSDDANVDHHEQLPFLNLTLQAFNPQAPP